MALQQKLHIKKLLELYPECNPFENQVWGAWVLSKEEVWKCVKNSRFYETPTRCGFTKLQHTQRVAWLVVSGWDDPIYIDVGVPAACCYPDNLVEDGNHRLAAAILRGDEFISVECSGDEELIDEIVGM